MIHDGASEAELARQAFQQAGSLADAALERLTDGDTSLEEVLRAIHQ